MRPTYIAGQRNLDVQLHLRNSIFSFSHHQIPTIVYSKSCWKSYFRQVRMICWEVLVGLRKSERRTGSVAGHSNAMPAATSLTVQKESNSLYFWSALVQIAQIAMTTYLHCNNINAYVVQYKFTSEMQHRQKKKGDAKFKSKHPAIK